MLLYFRAFINGSRDIFSKKNLLDKDYKLNYKNIVEVKDFQVGVKKNSNYIELNVHNLKTNDIIESKKVDSGSFKTYQSYDLFSKKEDERRK